MATAAQIAANRLNAQNSTGPRTAEGKARCAHNAVRHGLTAKHLIVRDDEREDFECLRAGLAAEVAPQGPLEQIVFDELIHAAWNLRRFRRLEAEAETASPDPLADPDLDAFLDRLARYQARAQRSWYRALKELRTLQTNRILRARTIDPDEEQSTPALASIGELIKQTQSQGPISYEIDLMRRLGMSPIVLAPHEKEE